MDNIFQDLIGEGIVIIYMDDMFLSTKTKDHLRENTRRVLQRFNGKRSISKTQKMQVLQREDRMAGNGNSRRKDNDGPRKTQRNSGLACPNHSETSMGLPGIQELLPAIHPRFLIACPTSKRTPEKRPKIRVDN